MEAGIYVGVSGQLALQRRLDTIANNVANSGTPGFRAENVSFESVLARDGVAYANPGTAKFSGRTGPMIQTDNPLDVAIQGTAYFAVSTPIGTVFTRDGRMRVSTTGELETLEGHGVLDAGGAPLQIDPARGSVQTARNGMLSPNGDRIGTIGPFRLPSDAQQRRGPGAGFTVDKAAEPVTDFGETAVVQGFIANANVNPVLEMARLIAVTRVFEAMTAAIDQSDRKLSDAIRALGSGQR